MSEYLEIVAGTAYQHVIATPASGVFAVGEGASVRVCARYFPMCRPFEMAAVAAILARVDRGLERRDRRLAYTKADLLDPAPVTSAQLAKGSMTIAAARRRDAARKPTWYRSLTLLRAHSSADGS